MLETIFVEGGTITIEKNRFWSCLPCRKGKAARVALDRLTSALSEPDSGFLIVSLDLS